MIVIWRFCPVLLSWYYYWPTKNQPQRICTFDDFTKAPLGNRAKAWPTEASEITESTPVPTQAATTIPQPTEPVQAEKPMGVMHTTEPEPTPKTTPTVPDPDDEAEKNVCQSAESAKIIEWPYITAPEQPTYTSGPEPMESPQEEPSPTPQLVPVVPTDPIDPIPEPTEQLAVPMHEPTAESTQIGYAECSCGARLTPDELVPRMKVHALNDESHSYRAY